MKNVNYTFVMLCLLTVNLSFAQKQASIDEARVPPPVITCADFELRNGQNYHAGWGGENAIATFDSLSMDNSDYRKAEGLPGNSYLYNSLYPREMIKFEGNCLCFDYKVIDDGIPQNSVNINPTIILFDGPSPNNSSVQAQFVANVTVTENSDWVHVCAPIALSSGSNLPGNSQGQWTNVTASQWDALIANVGSIGFNVDVGGARSRNPIIGIDNVCLQECEEIVDPSSDDGAYCCDGENLVKGGNFEDDGTGLAYFLSQYDNNSNLMPGQYQITNSAATFGTAVTDHSYCADPVQYANNNQFMVVNGKTQQTGNAVIYRQNISGLTAGKQYKVCANFKNLPQCTFDILPNVNIEISGAGSSGFGVISANPNDPCDWVNREFTFTATGSSTALSIILDETGNGDGNDLAIDDISITELVDPNLNITVQHQGNPQQITASLNSIDPSDDHLPGGVCQYDWYVAKVDNYSPLVIDWNTFASGNSGGNTTGNGNSPWNLTTTFPGYTFAQNTMYIVGMYLPECGCYGEGFTYQLTFNNRSTNNQMMSEEQKQKIIHLIKNGKPMGNLDTTSNKNMSSRQLQVFPNPSKGNFNLALQGDTFKWVEIFSVTGKPVFVQSYSEGRINEEIDISSFATGIYFIKAQSENGAQYNAKVIKE